MTVLAEHEENPKDVNSYSPYSREVVITFGNMSGRWTLRSLRRLRLKTFGAAYTDSIFGNHRRSITLSVKSAH